MSNLSDALVGAALGGLLSGSVLSFVGGVLLQRRTERIRAESERGNNQIVELIRDELARNQLRFKSTREREEEVLGELLGPVSWQLQRTRRGFEAWTSPDRFIENRIIREANVAARELLFAKGHLLPPEYWGDAHTLIEHYDRWLQEYEDVRAKGRSEEGFVFVGPKGFPFPREAEERLQEYFRASWSRLYVEDVNDP